MTNKTNVIVCGLNKKKQDLPLYFNHLTEIEINRDTYQFDLRVIQSSFYATPNHLMPFPRKTII
jgi:hypothetical protein